MFQLSEKRIPGLWASMLCRKRYIDDQVLDAARAGLEAVVILGASMDTRAYRMPVLARASASNAARKVSPANSSRFNARIAPARGWNRCAAARRL